jgi:hypothetical protein
MMRLNQIGFYALLILILSLNSCENSLPKIPDSNDPIFNVKGTVGLENLNLVAGTSNMYMSTFKSKMNGVDTYSGNLSDGVSGFKINIFSGDVDISGFGATEVFSFEKFSFTEIPETPILELSKEMFNNINISKIDWYVDGLFKAADNLSFTEPGIYNVCARATFTDNSQSEVCNEMIVGFKKNGSFKLVHNVSENSTLTAYLDDVNGEVESITWFVNNENRGTGNFLATGVTSGKHILRCDVKFQNGVLRKRFVMLNGGKPSEYMIDFAHVETQSPNIWDYTAFVSITILGIKYSSILAPNSGNFIDVHSFKYYGLNELNQKTYVLKGKLNATLKSELIEEFVQANLDISVGLVIQ